MSAVLAWEAHRDTIAGAVRLLRRRHDADSYDHVLADRIAASLDSLDAMFEPCAAELVAEGFEVDEALALVDRHADELRSRMGGKP